MDTQIVNSLADLQEGRFYRVSDLQRILKNLNLTHSIFTIRDAETWRCKDYHCGKRHDYPVDKCEKCGSDIRPPLINSPRTRGGKTAGHRRYTKTEINEIVALFSNR